ncbi:mannosyltransferase putative-domain-containing protein [Aspergillus pseudonomiae]|uniref:Mannosyltransferase putative-domain-containing protein n=1 Tax=Aspergillus pseudonomiae TaxID=1506151 RepID=A0A5N7DK85_9EURO|nr:mannosyltransferase putative-domain-containing protein [Aspergillus pseudonomiae]KAE8406851.1 mannosyltransferase putative-domain-containing protein [Aspergillus pseudonomiae]
MICVLAPRGLRPAWVGITAIAAAAVLSLFLLYSPRLQTTTSRVVVPDPVSHIVTDPNYVDNTTTKNVDPVIAEAGLIDHPAQYFIDYPLQPPYKEHFGELGQRSRVLRDWMTLVDQLPQSTSRNLLMNATERVAVSLYPFLDKPKVQNTTHKPVADLRASFEPGSAGVVIPTSNNTLRFAAHLIGAMRLVLNSTLPIQIVYAGDEDLSPDDRARLSSTVESGPPLEFLDILTVFDDTTLQLKTGGWAIKAFAALGSRFERVILADADAVFFQPPEVLLDHEAFLRSGALLFHDRLLWKNVFPERNEWYRSQIRQPSAALEKSLVWTENYAEEGDSGLVVLDKSRTDILIALLHICWQNSHDVREEVTYKMTYGDKETWWLGLELTGATYEFSGHYGGIVGWDQVDSSGRHKVCSFVIAHVDAKDRLLWYNGSLLKNKGKSSMTNKYGVPTHWMIDGKWQKGDRKEDMSCMKGGEPRNLTQYELNIMEGSIELAKNLDGMIYTAPKGTENT